MERLPAEIRTQAASAFELWRRDRYHQSLHFKRVHPSRPMFSVRVGLRYRALGMVDGDTITWFWIGSHADYDRLIGGDDD
jgi:hypothetical protein